MYCNIFLFLGYCSICWLAKHRVRNLIRKFDIDIYWRMGVKSLTFLDNVHCLPIYYLGIYLINNVYYLDLYFLTTIFLELPVAFFKDYLSSGMIWIVGTNELVFIGLFKCDSWCIDRKKITYIYYSLHTYFINNNFLISIKKFLIRRKLSANS